MSILWLEVKRFYVEPDDPAHPIVVNQGRHVLDVNRAAWEKGIRPGITAREARALTSEAEHRTWRHEDFEDRSRAWLDICLDYSGIVQPFHQHAAWVDLATHPNPTDIAERLVRDLSKATGRTIESGMAFSCWVARLAARHDDCGLASRDPKAFLSPLRTDQLIPVASEDRERLRFLGYSTIGSIASLPLSVLTSQFSELGLQIQAAARGAYADPVIPTYPPNHLVEKFRFESPTDLTLDIMHAAKELSDQMGSRLQADDRESIRVRFTIETEDGHHTVLRTFPRPLNNPASVFAALRALVKTLPPVPLLSLQLMLLDLQFVQAVQKPILDEGASRPKWSEQPLAHLKEIFGEQSILRASQIELPRRVRVLQEWKNALGWR